jgi:polysaccharide export outer membrane protein
MHTWMKTLAVVTVIMVAFVTGRAQQVTALSGPSIPAVRSANSEPASSAEVAGESGFQNRYPRYKLRPGDAFDISFELSPEFNQTVTVQPDGFVTLRGIGETQVKDLTVPELTATLRAAYGKILNDPLLTIVLKDFERAYFIADGQVAKPGKYDLRGDTTLTQAIAMAGGFTDSSKHSQVLLFRKASEGWYSAKIFNVKKMEKMGNLAEDPQLRPGDMLFVPKNAFSKFKAFLPSSSVGTFTEVKPW